MEDVSEQNRPEDRSVVANDGDVLVLQPIDATQMGEWVVSFDWIHTLF